MRARRMRDHQIPAVAKNGQHVALNVLAGALTRQKVAGPSIMPTGGERIADDTGELAGY
jgi:hypothetical protein